MRLDKIIFLLAGIFALTLTSTSFFGFIEALLFVGMVAVFTWIGYGFLVWIGGFNGVSSKAMLLAPAVGLITLGFLLAVGAATGLFGNVWFGVIGIGVLFSCRRFYRDYRKKTSARRVWVWGTVVIAILCCLYYIIPYAAGNGQFVEDRSLGRCGNMGPPKDLQYLDIDPSYDVAVTSVLMHSSPPHMPGMASERLHYHYASHSIAAAFAKLFHVDAAWGLAALQAATFFSLLLSLFALTGSLFPRQKWPAFALILTSFFGGATIIYRYGVQSLGSDGLTEILSDVLEFKFNRLIVHYYQFHSLIWTAVGLTVVFALLTMCGKNRSRIPSAVAIIAVMMIPFNFIAGAGLVGMVAVVTFYEKRENWIVTELFCAVLGLVIVLLFGGAQILNRIPSGSSEALALAGQIGIPLAQRLMRPWPQLLLVNINYILFNFPFAILLITWILKFNIRFHILWVASFVWMGGFLFAATFLKDDFNLALYSTLNLQIMAMMLNTIVIVILWIKKASWRADIPGRPELASSEIQGRSGMPALQEVRMKWTMAGLGITTLLTILLSTLTTSSIYWAIPPLVSLLIIYLLTKLTLRLPVLMAVSLWTLLTFGWMFKFTPTMVAAQTKVRPTFDYDEDNAVRASIQRIPEDALIATNRNDLDTPNGAGTSYLYSALTGRRFFLEGYRFGEQRVPSFKEIYHDNQTIFNSTDPDSVWEVLQRREIDYILCRPYTHIAAIEALTSKVELMPKSYDQCLYRVVR